MQLPINKKIIAIIIGSLVGIVAIISSVYAVGVWYEWYRVNAGTLARLNLRAVYNDCKDVTAAGNHIFVPTKSIGEWNNFKAVAPSLWIAVNPCPTTTVSTSNVDQQWWAWDVLYATCPAGTHIISGAGSPYYPGWGTCVGNWIYIWAYVYPGSSVQWGNGWTIDFYTSAANVPYYGDYNDMVSPDAFCGGWSLTITCEYD